MSPTPKNSGTAADFLGRFVSDEEFRNRLSDEDPAVLIQKIKEEGYDFTPEQFGEVIEEIKRSAASGPLDEAALTNVSGGVPILMAAVNLIAKDLVGKAIIPEKVTDWTSDQVVSGIKAIKKLF